jgi:hypothetical protein
MKTQEEILQRIEEVKENDFFGHQRHDLVSYLEFENAKPFLKEGVTVEQWQVETKTPKEKMTDYMEFAWNKANDKRGLSAARSMDHYTSWLWLDGDEELYKTLSDYEYYGKPQLIEICKYLGIEHTQYDDGVREND